MLSETVRAVIGIFGMKVVAREVQRQKRIGKVNRLVRLTMNQGRYTHLNLKISKIRVVYALGFAGGLKSSKEWVEENYAHTGQGDSL